MTKRFIIHGMKGESANARFSNSLVKYFSFLINGAKNRYFIHMCVTFMAFIGFVANQRLNLINRELHWNVWLSQ